MKKQTNINPNTGLKQQSETSQKVTAEMIEAARQELNALVSQRLTNPSEELEKAITQKAEEYNRLKSENSIIKRIKDCFGKS